MKTKDTEGGAWKTESETKQDQSQTQSTDL